MKSHNKVKVGIIATLCTTALPSLAYSDNYLIEMMPGIYSVPDSILSSMRGKYVSSTNHVVYFGVQMTSNWSAPDGTVMNAGSNFAIDISSPTPKLSFHPSVSLVSIGGGLQPEDDSKRTLDDSGVNNVSGVTQSIQTAGDTNVLENVVRLRMLDDIPDIDVAGSGYSDKSEELNYSNGSVALSATSTLNNDAVGVKLVMQGQGESEQTIRGFIQGAASGKGAFQRISVVGDNHVIVNSMEMGVVMQRESANFITQKDLGSAINHLRGINPNM